MTQADILAALTSVGVEKVFFGPQGFELFVNHEQVAQAQIGYGVDGRGEPISSVEHGKWQHSWLVVARDTELGDVYFIDLADDSCPVYIGFLGDKGWEIDQVALSLDAFMACLKLIFEQGKQSQAVFVAESDTVVEPIVLAQLQQSLIKTSGCSHYWNYFFECYADWLSDEAP